MVKACAKKVCLHARRLRDNDITMIIPKKPQFIVKTNRKDITSALLLYNLGINLQPINSGIHIYKGKVSIDEDLDIDFYESIKNTQISIPDSRNDLGFNTQVSRRYNKTTCLGVAMVVHYDNAYEGKNKWENKNIHIPFCTNATFNNNIYANIFRYIYEEYKKVNIKKIKVGHEHGTNKNDVIYK